MARKWINSQSTVPKGAEVLKHSGQLPGGYDTEQLWKQLTAQRDSALILSPELNEWFGKEFPPQLES
jgi:hypothetical protein